MAELITESRNVSRAIREEFRKLAPSAVLDNRLGRFCEILVALREDVLPALEQGALRSRPHEAMSAVEGIFAKALPQRVIVFGLADDAGYGEYDLWSEVRTQLSDLGIPDGLRADRVRFLGLSFPPGEKDNVLLHANLCHEVGHALIQDAHWLDRFIPELPGDEAIQHLTANIQPQDVFAALGDEGKAAAVTNLFARTGRLYARNGILVNWLEELLSDAVAICVLGPAAAFATVELLRRSVGLHSDFFGRTHPRSALRIELQRLHLGDWEAVSGDPSFEDLLAAYPKAYAYLEDTHAAYVGEPGRIPEVQWEHASGIDYRIERTLEFYEALEQALRNKLPDILEVVRTWLLPRGLLYTPADFQEEVPHLIAKLEALVPPSTFGSYGAERPASYAGIMNAGALLRRQSLDAFTAGIGPYQALEARDPGSGTYKAEELIVALIRKAIADSHVHRRWLSANAKASA